MNKHYKIVRMGVERHLTNGSREYSIAERHIQPPSTYSLDYSSTEEVRELIEALVEDRENSKRSKANIDRPAEADPIIIRKRDWCAPDCQT